MNHRDIPKPVRDKLLKFEQTVEHLTEKTTRTREAINNARERLTGSFQRDSDYHDMRSTLDKLIKDLPVIERRLADAEYTLEHCQTWLDALPDDVVLEPVKVKSNGADLADVREHVKKAEEELEALSQVPVPSGDIRERVKDYVAALGRPKVSGVSHDDKLKVSWPTSDATSLLAILIPDKMTDVILAEIERAANDPLPLERRRKRMIELRRMIDELQRQALALGADAYALPPPVILGVRVVRAVKKVERRVSAA